MSNNGSEHSIIPHGFDETVIKAPSEDEKRTLLGICQIVYRAYARRNLLQKRAEGKNAIDHSACGPLIQLIHQSKIGRKQFNTLIFFWYHFSRENLEALSKFPFIIEWRHIEHYVKLGPRVILEAAASSANIAEFSARLEHARIEEKRARAQQRAAAIMRRAASKSLPKLQPKLSKSGSINLNRKLLGSWGIDLPAGTAVQMKVGRDKSKITLILGLAAEHQRHQRRAARKSLAKPQPKLTREGSINLNKKLLDPWGINLPTVTAVQMKVSRCKTNITLILGEGGDSEE